ncbi:winged helix-turn-helix domain-containing protein [Flindersiella endophytica]
MRQNDQLGDGAIGNTAVVATQALVLCVGNAHELFSTIIRSVGTAAVVLVMPDARTAAEVLRTGVREPASVPDGARAPEPSVAFGGLRLSKPSRAANWRGRTLQLSERQFDLLLTLAGDPGRVWTFAELTESVWQRRYVGDDDAVASTVKRLRRAIAGVTPELVIESVRGVGYRLALLTTPLAPRERPRRTRGR